MTWLAAAPVIWAVHFLLCYGVAAVYCAKVGGSLGVARAAIAIFTAAALAALALVAWGARRRADRFVGRLTLLVSGLAAIAVVYEALAAVFIGSCG